MRKLIVLGFVGLLAQLIDGSLGMAYGVTSSTLLLAAGVAPAAASAAVHFSEIGTSLVSGFSHHKLGNVDWRTVSILAVPGFVGAFAGATFLASLDGDAAKPWVAGLLLGARRLRHLALPAPRRRAARRSRPARRRSSSPRWASSAAPWTPSVAAAGARSAPPRCCPPGRLEPRKVVGSIDTSEFVVAVGGSLGFIIALGSQGIEWGYAAALLVGGVIAAPIAAWLVKHLAARVLGVAAGGLIVLTNSKTIVETLGATGADRRAGHGRPRGALGDRHRLGRAAGAPLPRGPRARGVVRDGLTGEGLARGSSELIDLSERLAACECPPSPTTPCVPSSRWQAGPTAHR